MGNYEPLTYALDVRLKAKCFFFSGVHDYVTNITGDNSGADLVFMMDALDIWLQLSPKTLIARFEEMNTDGGVVTGADMICFPNEPDSVSCASRDSAFD